ncbi:acetaldehyde dehydrogenase (acetylating) [Aquibacillus halophilus]|uniref:Acetaldehyde dehydrogenase (Acetylating) n=1 Tax=Aquibacillus halophilus TaxID=930132 RepID=A0A6A8D776_9BACI|nr:acetaldehyde dehydrogenase (acetylating) [Aquibacillus halophilus]
MKLDDDLQAIQEVRNALQQAKEAQAFLGKMSQIQIDEIVLGLSEAATEHSETLATIAVKETGFGNVVDKTAKNLFASVQVYEGIKNLKTVGIINKDEVKKVWEVAQPVGVIAGIVPSTNPTSTVIFKSLIALKSRNAIVFSPHPSAQKCTLEAVTILRAAVKKMGAPEDVIQCLTKLSMSATKELMAHTDTDLILATGGTAMVKSAYSSGKPAYGVGPGNVPVYFHTSADLGQSVKQIIQSKTFDYGTICASEQAIVVDLQIKKALKQELERQGAYFLNDDEKTKVAAIIMAGSGMNPGIVGKSPQVIAEIAGITIPIDCDLLIAEEQEIGINHPFSVEKLCPILALYTATDWIEGRELCGKLLELGGLGHTLGIHCLEESVIEAFGLEMPASRIIINSGTTFGGIGATTGIQPSLTLGCGTFGNNITTDNIGPMHLLNIKRVAFGVREMEAPVKTAQKKQEDLLQVQTQVNRDEVFNIVKSILSELKQ